jgi:hypothetical protein
MAEPTNPDAGPSVPTLSFDEIKQEIARRNELNQKAARKVRALREKADIARRRSWERL